MLPVFSLPALFLVYVVAIASIVAMTLVRFLSARERYVGLSVLAIWFSYEGLLGASGVAGKSGLPFPGVLILLAPVLVFVATTLVRGRVGGLLAARIPISLLIGLQAFRVGVEATLHRLWELGTVPKLMTLGGGNVEILIGLSAPLFAWIATRGAAGRRIALAWNIVALVSLLNVATRAVLSAPGPFNLIHAEVLNTALGSFPFTFIPGFMAPLAVMLHVLSLRALRRQQRGAAPEVHAPTAALS